MRRIIFLYLLCVCQLSFSQKYDYRWVIGDPGGNIDLLFTDSSAHAISHHRDIEMSNGQTTISDSAGNLLFFTNGAKVFNVDDSIMQNGDSLNYGAAWVDYYGGMDYDAIEDIVGLPTDTVSIWNLIHYYEEYTPNAPPFL